MKRQYVALLRAISNVRMQPFCESMEELGFSEVESFGMSGNFLFNSDNPDTEALERRIEAKFNTAAFVRTRRQLGRIVAGDPYGSNILFLMKPPTATRRRAFLKLEFEGPKPVLRGKTIYFVHPSRLSGKRTPTDFEVFFGLQGTVRSAQVVVKLLERMTN